MAERHAPAGVALLRPYRPAYASAVLGWVGTVEEASAWAGLDRAPVIHDLARWHAEPGVVPFVWLDGDVPVGYGEIWEDRDGGEVELARILVAPARRGRGEGRLLVGALADEARRSGFHEIWLRVVPANAAAIRAYEAAGFERATKAEEASFNEGQPRIYRWMRARAEAP